MKLDDTPHLDFYTVIFYTYQHSLDVAQEGWAEKMADM